MAEYNINKIKLPNGDIVKLVDETSGYAKSSEVPTVVDTYSSTGTDAVSGKAVNAALQTLDSSITATTGEAISAITITDGKISGSSKISVGDANQNAFSNVKVGSTTIAADTTTDTLELVAGTDITLTPDSTNDKVTIAFNNNSGYTKNTGTVTSVGLQNATNGGLSVSGSPITSSGTISVGHSNVLTNAQTTQALYPIAIDKNGHISSYGTAVDPEDIFLFEVTGTQSQGSSTINYTTTTTPAQISDALSEGKIPVVKLTFSDISTYHYYNVAFEESNSFHYMFISPFDGGDSFVECIASSATASSFTEIYVSTSEYSYASHVHGNITTDGQISSSAIAPGNGDYILISDSSGSNEIERGIAIGTGTTKYLREDGTWQTVSTSDTKVKMTSTTSGSEYPIILGPTSITSGNDYEAYYNSSVTINASSQQITSKGVKIYYDANSNFTISQSGYQGDSTNNTPRVKFESLKANTSGSSDKNVILTGVTTPTGTSSSYDNYAASKKYVDDRVGVTIRTWS